MIGVMERNKCKNPNSMSGLFFFWIFFLFLINEDKRFSTENHILLLLASKPSGKQCVCVGEINGKLLSLK